MKKILVIEDNEGIRSNAAEILELSNYDVVTAENGKVGLEKALEIRPDLILCDIIMPELDGYGVLHALQKNDAVRLTPFIFLTAKAEHADLRKGMALGADDYLIKPFDGTELLTAIDGRLRKNEALRNEVALPAQQMLNESSGLKALEEFKEGRNTNHYKKKQVIYTEGNHPNRLYYVLKGKVKAYKINDYGKELVTDIFGEGDFVGHVALLERTVYNDNAQAMEESELAIISKEDFDTLIDTHPEVTKRFVQILAKNISEKENQLLNLAYNSLRRKVADAILMMYGKCKMSEQNSHIIEVSRENLATVAGTATESLIRTLSDFKEEKLIELHGSRITILDMHKLKTVVN